jgi:hypothetical protein
MQLDDGVESRAQRDSFLVVFGRFWSFLVGPSRLLLIELILLSSKYFTMQAYRFYAFFLLLGLLSLSAMSATGPGDDPVDPGSNCCMTVVFDRDTGEPINGAVQEPYLQWGDCSGDCVPGN